MGLFGSKPKTSTEVKPDKNVESLLRNIVTETKNLPEAQFIAHEMAKLNPQEQQAITNLSQSGDLRKAANILSPALTQGINQITQNNAQYQSIANNPITTNEVLQSKQLLQKGLQQHAINQGVNSTIGLAAGNKSGAVKRALRANTANIQAQSALNPSATNIALTSANQNRENALNTTGQLNSIANRNVQLGLQGADLSQQATGNQLQAGNIQQQLAQANAQNDWQNANAEAQFPWQMVNNKLNIMNEVSGMAGYKTSGVGAGVSKGQQIGGALISGIGLAGKAGAFGTSANDIAGAFGGADSKNGGAVANGDALWEYAQKNGTPVNMNNLPSSNGFMSKIGSYFG